jgi:hypothetical protein
MSHLMLSNYYLQNINIKIFILEWIFYYYLIYFFINLEIFFLDYNPLMGSGSGSNYRPPRRSPCSGGGCG